MVRSSHRRLALDAVAGVLLVGSIGMFDLAYGAIAGGGSIVTRYLGGRVAAFAFAQVVIVVLTGRIPESQTLLIAEAGAMLFLFVPPVGENRIGRYAGATSLGLVVGSGLVIAGVQTSIQPWVTAAVIAGTTVLVAAVLARYEQVTLGAITDE